MAVTLPPLPPPTVAIGTATVTLPNGQKVTVTITPSREFHQFLAQLRAYIATL